MSGVSFIVQRVVGPPGASAPPALVDMNDANVLATAFGSPMPAATVLRIRNLTTGRGATLPTQAQLGAATPILYIVSDISTKTHVATLTAGASTYFVDGNATLPIGTSANGAIGAILAYDGIQQWTLLGTYQP